MGVGARVDSGGALAACLRHEPLQSGDRGARDRGARRRAPTAAGACGSRRSAGGSSTRRSRSSGCDRSDSASSAASARARSPSLWPGSPCPHAAAAACSCTRCARCPAGCSAGCSRRSGWDGSGAAIRRGVPPLRPRRGKPGRRCPRPVRRPTLAPGGRERLTALRGELVAGGAAPELVGRLADTIEGRRRPRRSRACARTRSPTPGERIGVPCSSSPSRRPVPGCSSRAGSCCARSAAAPSRRRALGELESHAHCDSCDVDVVADLDRSLELVFRPHPALREVTTADSAWPGRGSRRTSSPSSASGPGNGAGCTCPWRPGGYRTRRARRRGQQTLRRFGRGRAHERRARRTRATRNGFASSSGRPGRIRPPPRREVTALQAFRDLFASEALRPGEELKVGTLAVALHRSARLDPALPGDRRRACVRIGRGSLRRASRGCSPRGRSRREDDRRRGHGRLPPTGVRAEGSRRSAARARRVRGPRRPLLLKAGVHLGPCLAVTLNERLDYFGSTVNLAARIVGLSSGKDVVVSEAVRSDPEVAELLAGGGLVAEPLGATLKGFEERFQLWRVTRGG